MPVELQTPYWKKQIETYNALRTKGLSMYQSAIKAGYTSSEALNATTRVEPQRQLLIKDSLPLVGCTNIRVAETIKEALNATKQDDADHKIRMNAARMIAELTGQIDTKATVAVQINLPAVAVNKDAWGEE